MPRAEETYIVRVRPDEGDALVEGVRSRRRQHVRELSEVGRLIAQWLRRDAQPSEPGRPTKGEELRR